MSGEERRAHIINYLARQEQPVSGAALARKFGVSRQVIVQDIALLRSANAEIVSTNRGYIVSPKSSSALVRTFTCRHTDELTEDEFNCIVDQGGAVENVFVNHKLYGRIEAEMHIRSRRDVREFIHGLHSGKSTLLKNVTSDYHYHTISAETSDILDDIETELAQRGYLVKPKENRKKDSQHDYECALPARK